MARLLDLDDPACQDDRQAGGKAASLARARAAGLPALGGVVLPVAEASDAFLAGAAGLDTGGSGAARLALMEAPLDDALLAELAASGAAQGAQIVVRSSSPLEAEGAWSGAFTSYTDATPDDLPVLVRGCWSSAFNLDVLERWQAAGLAAGQLAMAVLIQPALTLDAGGMASIDATGAVTVVGMRGQPDALMAGWAPGQRAVVDADEAVSLDAGDDLDEALAARVATLSRNVLERLQASSIEWGLAGGELYLLQAQGGPPTDAAGPDAVIDAAYRAPQAHRVAAHVLACQGPLGDALVLPWALALPGPLPGTATSLTASPDPPEALGQIRALASDLIARTWRQPAAEAASAAAGLLRDLSGTTPERGFDRLDKLRPIGREAGAELVGDIEVLGQALVQRGAIPHARSIWAFTATQLERLVGGEAVEPTITPAADRWRWLLHATAVAQGESATGTAASPGQGAGRLRLLRTEADAAAFRPGEVIVAPYPVNWIGPLLWAAAGLVTAGGSPAAHLIEVARWLKVPAVVHCALPDGALAGWALADGAETGGAETGGAGPDTPTIVAVDGDRGAVSWLSP